MKYYLGWDVGAWHCDKNNKSKDALACLGFDGESLVIIGESKRQNLRSAIVNFSGLELIGEFLSKTGPSLSENDECVIAIDAPLAWPKEFVNLIKHGTLPPIQPEFRSNQLLFRQVETDLSKYRKTPLSPVQDGIGSQSTKSIYFLRQAGLRMGDTGVWKPDPGSESIVAIETYPAPIKDLNIDHPLMKKIRDHYHGDILDAFYCAYAAYLYDQEQGQLHKPTENSVKEEGWIWLPEDCWKAPGNKNT